MEIHYKHLSKDDKNKLAERVFKHLELFYNELSDPMSCWVEQIEEYIDKHHPEVEIGLTKVSGKSAYMGRSLFDIMYKYQKHFKRLDVKRVGRYWYEIILTNSHDETSN